MNQDTNLTRTAQSNESGNYNISNLPIGFYQISATAPGFKKFVLTRVEGDGGNNFINIHPDAIAEFRVLTSNYRAEYGGSAGAVISIAVKSGATDFHGIGYEFFRNDAIQARAYNALTVPELRFNNFGWNVSGPIYIPKLFNKDKNKLFFFVGEDFKRLRQGATNTWTVPTLAQRRRARSPAVANHEAALTAPHAKWRQRSFHASRPSHQEAGDSFPKGRLQC